MIKEHKKQFIYIIGMLTLSFVPIMMARSYQQMFNQVSSHTTQITQQVLADMQELYQFNQMTIKRRMEEEAATLAASYVQEEEGYKAKADELNMAYYFADDADTSDISQSYATKVFDRMTALDKSWTENVYYYMQKKPASAASSLGISADPRIQVLNSFEDIQLNVTDGDGRQISLYSNADAIMSLANVYTYYHDPEDYDAFLKYCQVLWEASHSYSLGISDIYYCDGTCVDNQEREGEDWIETLDEMVDEELMNDLDETKQSTASNADIQATPSNPKPEEENVPALCLGHVDLKIHMKITGLDEECSLFQIDPIGNQPTEIHTEDNETSTLKEVWPGWNEQTMSEARSLYKKDWYASYGLTTSSIALGNPLSLSEIEAMMRSLPEDLSDTRKNVIRFALESVGKVPYYYGGKASRAGYEGNHFGSLVSEDENGRILKGLDCSGWIGWIYWTAAGMEMPYATTFTLSSAGREIDRSELKPGDILVRTGKNAHVVMFLEWTADGQMRCIHESSTAANNVILSDIHSSFPICRRLLDD